LNTPVESELGELDRLEQGPPNRPTSAKPGLADWRFERCDNGLKISPEEYVSKASRCKIAEGAEAMGVSVSRLIGPKE
jgi:hypothetical protein